MDKGYQRYIVLICDGDTEYNKEIVDLASSPNISDGKEHYEKDNKAILPNRRNCTCRLFTLPDFLLPHISEHTQCGGKRSAEKDYRRNGRRVQADESYT